MSDTTTPPETPSLPSDTSNTNTLNKLRAAVLGANDGIVSVASVAMGVAGATNNHQTIVVAGLAALVAGALSMAVGEYVSVSSQSDAEKAYIEQEKHDLDTQPEYELKELAEEYMKRGVSEETALKVAEELTAKDALKAHLQVHFNLDPDDINNPMHAAVASFAAFSVGGLIPFLAVTVVPEAYRIPATVAAVFVALIATGFLSATVGGASRARAMVRVVLGGMAAMIVTYFVGVLFGVGMA